MRLVAVVPSHDDAPPEDLLEQVVRRVDQLVLVDDGSSAAVASVLASAAAATGSELVRLPRRCGKGSAIRAGIDHALRTCSRLDAVMVIDADGQHSPDAIPLFINAAARADLVIGDRFADLSAMPPARRVANRVTQGMFVFATGHPVRDTQNGMRLLRRNTLASFPSGGYEAETTHLRRVLSAGLPVAWVPVPTIYSGERSSFRPVRDSIRVLWALARPARLESRPTAGLSPAAPPTRN
jgi:glycosyltransferase involved in cell wall biosynthesis